MDAREAHWNHVYGSKKPEEVSWFQPSPSDSMKFVRRLSDTSARVIDVGAGASGLVDALLDAGYRRPIALDVSAEGLQHAKRRLESRADLVDWVVADVTSDPALPEVDLWHDRAVLHFLTDPGDQRAYAVLAARTVRRGGHAVIATFAPDGPERCSGLAVQRHHGASVAALLGTPFELLEEERKVHPTPSGIEQRFCWSLLRRT
jgi:SAM-dependent methyltransferase